MSKGQWTGGRRDKLFPISVSFSRAVLLCNGSLFQQHQLIPACSFPNTSKKHPQHTLSELPEQLTGSPSWKAWVPGPQSSHPTLHRLSGDLSPSSNGSILQMSEFLHFNFTLVSKGSICVVWLKPPCNPYGSLFAFLVFPLLVNNSLCQAVC